MLADYVMMSPSKFLHSSFVHGFMPVVNIKIQKICIAIFDASGVLILDKMLYTELISQLHKTTKILLDDLVDNLRKCSF